MTKTLQANRSTKKKREKKSTCPQCKDGPEYYRMLYNQYKFDVDKAREITSDEREVVLLERDDVEYAVEWAHIHEPHIDHVDLQYPGIVAHYWFPNQDGTILHGTVLIDGHHRAAKSLKENTPFFVRLLTEQESREVTVRQPEPKI